MNTALEKWQSLTHPRPVVEFCRKLFTPDNRAALKNPVLANRCTRHNS